MSNSGVRGNPDDMVSQVVGLLGDSGADVSGTWQIDQLAGGFSRHTYRLGSDRGDAYIVRAQPPGALLDTDLEREFRVYQQTAAAGLPVPTPYAIDTGSQNCFGGPYFVMEQVVGESPHVWQKGDRAALEGDWRNGGAIAEEFVQALAQLHSVDLGKLGFLGPPRTFGEVVDYWRAIYNENALVVDPIVDEAFAWVRERDPGAVTPTLVHADYRIGNVLLHGGRLRAVIDWELAYLGDPLFDVGYAMMPYYAGKFLTGGSELVGAVAETEWFLTRYGELRGVDLDREAITTYTVLGTLSLVAIIAIGIRMFVDGRTQDPRLVWNRFAVAGLRQDIARAIGW